MDIATFARRVLLVVQASVAVTALAGGIALIIGSFAPEAGVAPGLEFLDGSPFTSYLVPGILLAALLGGTHALAFVMLLRRLPFALFVSAATGFGMLIWIFVQMILIPASWLHAVYFAAGLAEVGLVMVLLGLFAPAATRASLAPASRARRPAPAR